MHAVVSGIRSEPRARPWLYAYAVFILWALVPEVRRVIDWRSSFSSISLVSIVPLLSLLPAAAVFLYTSRLRKVGRELLIVAWIWCGGFGYAYAVGLATGNAPAATYTLAGFLLPMFFGLCVATFEVPALELYERLAKFALALSVPIALYAIFQFAAPPPWDLYWIQQTGFVNVGSAIPFAFRPFATLNGPGPYADFIVGVLVLNLPRLRGANWLRLAAIAIDLAALALTLVRADWIALLLAILVFVALGPRKVANLSAIAVLAIAVVLFSASYGSLLANTQSGVAIQSRFESLGSLTTDSSFVDRQAFLTRSFAAALAEPTGEGLGVTGTAAKLGSSGATVDFDNGYVARFTEMGYFGMLAYLGTVVAMLGFSIRRWWLVSRTGDAPAAAIVAAAIGLQVALAFLDFSGDHHNSFPGIFLWLTFAIVFGSGKIADRA